MIIGRIIFNTRLQTKHIPYQYYDIESLVYQVYQRHKLSTNRPTTTCFDEKEICHRCAKYWSDDRDPDRLNLLMFCDGECGCLFHQTCHMPPALVVPPDDVPWYCGLCELTMALAVAEKIAADHGAI